MHSKEPYTTLDDLLKILPKDFSYKDRQMIIRAYQTAANAHEGQKRLSGEPYITHCVAVASILAEELSVPAPIIAAALLHDTVEDTSLKLEDIRSDFGKEIADMVQGVTKMKRLPRVSQEDAVDTKAHAPEPMLTRRERSKREQREALANETLRKILLTMNDNIGVVLIKLADRLHNMRTLNHMPEEKQKRIARQTMDIFAPLANRLGIWQLKWQLEDLSFRYLEPKKYQEIASQLEANRAAREREIQAIIAEIQTILRENAITAEVTGRPKHIYSIYRKMQRKGNSFDMVRDIRGVRLLIENEATCYTALGLIHMTWRPIPGEFDDYIANPKDNFYRSLHTAVIYSDKKPLEIQIRTYEMHKEAEYGIAAHWRYKENNTTLDKKFQERINWLRQAMDWSRDIKNADEFVQGMKEDVFARHIVTLTPKGDLIDLPEGATPIDFAYKVHTDIGHRCRGARVNSKLVPLNTPLKNGDTVEILTIHHGGPSRDWLNPALNLIKTTRARNKIRQYLRKQEMKKKVLEGREIIQTELRRLGIAAPNFLDLAQQFNCASEDIFFAAIASGDINTTDIINTIAPTSEPETSLEETIKNLDTVTIGTARLFHITGIPQGTQAEIAKCCQPVYGEPIIGLVTRMHGVRIHRQDCANILKVVEKGRLIQVSWGTESQTYPVTILIKAYDRPGLMSDILKIIDKEHINVIKADSTTKKWSAQITITIEVQGLEQLSRILGQISTIPNVIDAYRLRNT